jgi:hypothetical protein
MLTIAERDIPPLGEQQLSRTVLTARFWIHDWESRRLSMVPEQVCFASKFGRPKSRRGCAIAVEQISAQIIKL